MNNQILKEQVRTAARKQIVEAVSGKKEQLNEFVVGMTMIGLLVGGVVGGAVYFNKLRKEADAIFKEFGIIDVINDFHRKLNNVTDNPNVSVNDINDLFAAHVEVNKSFMMVSSRQNLSFTPERGYVANHASFMSLVRDIFTDGSFSQRLTKLHNAVEGAISLDAKKVETQIAVAAINNFSPNYAKTLEDIKKLSRLVKTLEDYEKISTKIDVVLTAIDQARTHVSRMRIPAPFRADASIRMLDDTYKQYDTVFRDEILGMVTG